MASGWMQIAKQMGTMRVRDIPAFVRSVVTKENVERGDAEVPE